MSRTSSILALFVAILAIWQTPSISSAQTRDETLARQLFETGRSYFERAQYEEAAEAFAEAYRLSGRPQLLVNHARALESMGENAAAVEVLERALVELPASSGLRPPVESRLVRLRAQVEREELAAAEAAEVAALAEAEVVADPAQVEGEGGRGVMWWSGVGSVSLGGASLVAALGTGIASHNLAQELDDACPNDQCPPELEDDVDRGNALSAASTAMLVVGLAASATGIVLMLLGRGDDEEPEVAGVEFTAGPGELGAGMRMRF